MDWKQCSRKMYRCECFPQGESGDLQAYVCDGKKKKNIIGLTFCSGLDVHKKKKNLPNCGDRQKLGEVRCPWT